MISRKIPLISTLIAASVILEIPGDVWSQSLRGNAAVDQNTVRIQQAEKRMKATIPSEASPREARKPNLVYRGIEAAAQGVYHLAKFTVEGIGRGTDVTISAVQRGTRKVYDFLSKPFRKESTQQPKKN